MIIYNRNVLESLVASKTKVTKCSSILACINLVRICETILTVRTTQTNIRRSIEDALLISKRLILIVNNVGQERSRALLVGNVSGF